MGTVHASVTFGRYEVVTLTNGTFRENCYVLLSGERGVLIDPGSEPGFISDYCDSRGVHLEKIILTHGHFDHLGAVSPLMERYNLICEVNASERALVRQASTYAFRFDRKAAVRPPRNVIYTDGPSTEWSGGTIHVVPTPGHTSGSVALRVDAHCIFTGDTLFREKIGPTTYPESDPAAIELSVKRLLQGQPDGCALLPGHGRPWTVGEAQTWISRLSGEMPQRAIF
jgi:glyoxylase-like metal-dependent hydrolase (beta-lactamase superfamily II)